MRWLLLPTVAAVLVAGCQAAPEAPTAAERPIVITSGDLGAPERIASGFRADAPERIVSLATGVGETLVALGALDRVVGRDETSDLPELSDVPIVTQAHDVSAERILALRPDLVIVDSAVGPPEALDQLRVTGVRIIEVPEAWTINDIAPRTAAVAEAIGATEVTIPQIRSVQANTDTKPTVAFLYLRGTAAIYLLGGAGSGADALITEAGGIDVGAAAGYPPFTPLTAEALASANPDILIVMTKGLESVGGIDGLIKLPGIAQTTAARNRAVIAVDDGVLLSFGPRTPALVEQLSTAFETLR
jgi:iron complex transport system substrate-binding protein